ncbi:aliphatic sulfonates-binding protein precursor, putative [Babesia caballi]|uniref:Aliphatic sulfonates-binding protein, putative n=1 Tax=Babesia caballi TaxID=5871 RepID=A0AAV4LP37_BABCB|nr:aliphatic sulfonates-binding protein precursor, putative [Babesia caballi]
MPAAVVVALPVAVLRQGLVVGVVTVGGLFASAFRRTNVDLGAVDEVARGLEHLLSGTVDGEDDKPETPRTAIYLPHDDHLLDRAETPEVVLKHLLAQRLGNSADEDLALYGGTRVVLHVTHVNAPPTEGVLIFEHIVSVLLHDERHESEAPAAASLEVSHDLGRDNAAVLGEVIRNCDCKDMLIVREIVK